MKAFKIVAGYVGLIVLSVWLWENLPVRIYGKRIAGHVVDATTGKPIETAYVSFLWRAGISPSGFTGHNSRDICYHAAAAITDADGRFVIEPWAEWTTYSVSPTAPIALVYAPGYLPEQLSYDTGPIRAPTVKLHERYRLWPFVGSVDRRLNVLFMGLANQGCWYGGESQMSLFPMLHAIYYEARGMATTSKQRETVDAIAVQAAVAAVNPDMYDASQWEKVEAFVKEHMR